jgi:hypothetical protein
VSRFPNDDDSFSFPLTAPFSVLLPLLPLVGCGCCFFGDSEVNEGMPVVVVLNLRGKITSCNYGEREEERFTAKSLRKPKLLSRIYRNIIIWVQKQFTLRIVLNESLILQYEALKVDWICDDGFALQKIKKSASKSIV